MDTSIKNKKDLLRRKMELRKEKLLELQKKKLSTTENEGDNKSYITFTGNQEERKENNDETLNVKNNITQQIEQIIYKNDIGNGNDTNDIDKSNNMNSIKNIQQRKIEERKQKLLLVQKQKMKKKELDEQKKIEELKKEEYIREQEEKKRHEEERRKNEKELFLKEKQEENKKGRNRRAALLLELQKKVAPIEPISESITSETTIEKENIEQHIVEKETTFNHKEKSTTITDVDKDIETNRLENKIIETTETPGEELTEEEIRRKQEIENLLSKHKQRSKKQENKLANSVTQDEMLERKKKEEDNIRSQKEYMKQQKQKQKETKKLLQKIRTGELGSKDYTFVFIIVGNDCKDYYKKCLHSIDSQSYDKWRIIYVLNGVENETDILLNSYVIGNQIDEKCTIVTMEERKPLYMCYMEAIQMCDEEEICCFMDSHDWLSQNNSLDRIHKMYKKKECLLVYSNYTESKNGKLKNGSKKKNYSDNCKKNNLYRKEGRLYTPFFTVLGSLCLQVDDNSLKDSNGNWKEDETIHEIIFQLFELSDGNFENLKASLYVVNKDSVNQNIYF